MADNTKVPLVHPNLPGAEYLAAPDAVAGWEARGWKKAGIVIVNNKEKANG
jgi:hypothetical protein